MTHNSKRLGVSVPSRNRSAGETTEFLRHLIAAPGILTGYDLISGEEYAVVVPVDIDEFLHAHQHGPARSSAPALDVTTPNGDSRRTRAFVRSYVLPFAADGNTTHVTVRFKTNNSMEPSEAIVAACHALDRAAIKYHLERAVLTGVWVMWILLNAVVQREYVESLAHRIREILRMIGITESSYIIPLMADERQTLHLPSPFYSGGFLGELVDVDHPAELRRSTDSTGATVGKVGPSAACASLDRESGAPHGLDELLHLWHSRHGSRAFRAGDLVALGSQSGNSASSSGPPQSAAVSTGRMLLAYARTKSGRFHLSSTRSGNSTVYRIEPRSGVEEDSK